MKTIKVAKTVKTAPKAKPAIKVNKSFGKTDMTRREYRLAKKKMQLEYGKGREAQKTRRVEAVTAGASMTADAVSGSATAGASISASEQTKREQLKLVNPVISQHDGEDDSVQNESSSDPEGNIPFM